MGDELKVWFSAHAIRRMFERGIDRSQVAAVLREGPSSSSIPMMRPIQEADARRGRRSAASRRRGREHSSERGNCGHRIPAGSPQVGRRLPQEELGMKCTICTHGSTEPGSTTVTVQREQATLIFRGVPAEVCDNCGEYYLDGPTADRIFTKAEEAIRGGAEIEIIRYAA